MSLPAISYAPRTIVWPAETPGLRDGARVGVRLPTGEQVWAGQNIEAMATPVADGGTARLPASVATCRSDEYVVLERIQGLPSTPLTPDDSAYLVTGVPALDPGLPWADADGNVLPRGRILVSQGDGWCNWESLALLVVTSGPGEEPGEDGYLRDPFGMLADRERASFDAHARLPANARATGWKQQGVALWLTNDAAYLVFGDRTERWPRLTRAMGCA